MRLERPREAGRSWTSCTELSAPVAPLPLFPCAEALPVERAIEGQDALQVIHFVLWHFRERARCRVDMAGGTIDIWPLYLFHHHAVTVNFAVDRYASCVLETRADSRIVLRSRDLAGSEEFESIEALAAAQKYKLPLLAYLLRY